MRRLLAAASNLTLSLALALVVFTGIVVAGPDPDPGIRCQGPPPSCTEVIPCLRLKCCDVVIIFYQCGCNCF